MGKSATTISKLTTAERNALGPVPADTIIYNLTENSFQKYNFLTSSWITINATGIVGGSFSNPTGPLDVNSQSLIVCPYNATITGWDIIAGDVGSVVIDVWKANNSVPTVANTVTAGAKPSLTAAQLAESTAIPGWVTSVVAGDVFIFNIDSVSTITQLTISLRLMKS